jgi:hypothetical protein
MFKHIFHGNSIQNSGDIGNRAALTNVIAAILSAIVGISAIYIPGLKDLLSQDDILLIASALATIITTINAYYLLATNVASGLKSK